MSSAPIPIPQTSGPAAGTASDGIASRSPAMAPYRFGPLGHGTDLLRGAVDLVVLSVVSTQAMSADAVHRQIETLSTCQLSPADHVVYHSLERMRGWGWLELIESPANVEATVQYRITRTGKRRLLAEQHSWIRLASAATALITATQSERQHPRRRLAGTAAVASRAGAGGVLSPRGERPAARLAG